MNEWCVRVKTEFKLFRVGSSGRVLWTFLMSLKKWGEFLTIVVTVSFWVWTLLCGDIWSLNSYFDELYIYFDIFVFMVSACLKGAGVSNVTWLKQLFIFRTLEEKTLWLNALCKAIEELCKRKSSFKVGTERSSPVELQKPPDYIKMDGIQKCMDCSASFGVMKRKHHCRACGSVSERNEMY
jgi:hypothetical protein